MSDDGVIAVALDGKMFSRVAVLRVMCEIASCGGLDFFMDGDDCIIVVNNAQLGERELRELIVKSAVDNQLRIELEASYAKIRGLLIAKAIESSVEVDVCEESFRGKVDE